MKHLEVSCAVRRIYTFVRRQRVKNMSVIMMGILHGDVRVIMIIYRLIHLIKINASEKV